MLTDNDSILQYGLKAFMLFFFFELQLEGAVVLLPEFYSNELWALLLPYRWYIINEKEKKHIYNL